MAVLRFVDSIQASPTVRLNLNDLSVWGMSNETSFGTPEMKRSVTSSMMRDGDYVGASAYGNRVLNLVLHLFHAGDNAATQLQLLQRELDRPTNLLQYTPGGTTNTVFFRTFRTPPESVRWDIGLKQVRVQVLAEPFALGLREDIGPITVNNNPAAGSNGLFADLTGIKGDVETPLMIEYADGGGGLARNGFSIGVRSGPSPYPNRFLQAESMNQNTDTSAVADAAFSGGNKSRCTFTTQQVLTTRISGKFPSATVPSGAENWGVYRVFARVAQTVAGDVMQMDLFIGNASTSVVTIKSQTAAQLVDLGTVDSTFGTPTAGGYAASEYRIEDQPSITGPLLVRAGRVSGSGSLDIDYVVFVPADECFGTWTYSSNVTSATHLSVVDAVSDSFYTATALSGATPGRLSHGFPVAITGRLPRVMPGNNRLVIVESSEFPGAANAITTSITATIRYWPRYLLTRPLTT